ncbi:MFS transporter [Methylobacterium gnaphalii]|uniref:MFS transporter n=1 Tax=Methylobacterium gnaphalii TaxID=1010610 RepID=UPI0011BE73A2|nr:MFS transporter [Methylobacterium gnaphalii]GJD68684.1 putative transporter YycB [Methylobacterium gnaphalii]
MTTRTDARPHNPLLVGLAVTLVAFNLRPALTSVGPLLTQIVAETGCSATTATALTTLPVLCLGIGGAFGPPAIRRLGVDAGILAGLVAVLAGLLLRGLGGLPALFAGAALSGLGIGLSGVLLPALVKRDFSRRAGRATGLYTMALCIGAGAAAGLTVPLEHWLGQGWAAALAFWALPALIAVVAWIPFARPRPAAAAVPSARPTLRLWQEPLAWQVAGFMGLQSSLAYIQFGWLPAMLQGRGLDPVEAGYLTALSAFAQAPGALVVPTLAAGASDQRGWIVGSLFVTVSVFAALGFGPARGMLPAAIVQGFALGGCFGLGLTVIVLRARDAASAGALSAMAQGFGYTLASLGPFGFGLAHEISGGWGLPTLLFASVALGAALCGLGAGRNQHVGQAPRGP